MAKEWTIREHKFLEENYPHKGAEFVSKELGRTYKSVIARAQKYGIRSKVKRSNAFEPGHTPWNKGVSYMPNGSEKTWFKKGVEPVTAKPMFEPYKRREGDKMIWVIRTEKRIVRYNRYLWERHNGPIPEGHVIAYADFNTENNSIENLICISRSENIKRSAHHPDTDRSMSGVRAWETRDRNMRKRLGLPEENKGYQI